MKKLQQFNVYSLTYERIKNSNFDIKLNFDDAEKNDELIALADSECLRAIRRITNSEFDEFEFEQLKEQRKFLIKQNNFTENKKKIIYINKKIKGMLFISQFISIYVEKKSKYPNLIRHGFMVNGIKYKRFMVGAAHARTNRSMWVSEDIYDELEKIINNGVGKVEIILAKWNAYKALSQTATRRVLRPRVCIVADKELIINKNVDWAVEDKSEDDIVRINKNLKYNMWDGMGIISPEFSKVWVDYLNIDYNPSAFLIRFPFGKGLLCQFDFHKFADEVSHNYIIKDLYGNEKDVREIDVVLTQSQFKLWNAYNSWEQFENECDKSGLCWGISRISPKKENDVMRTNYQFLQVLNLSDNDIVELCQPTIDFFDGASKKNIGFMELYMLGKLVENDSALEIWNNINDPFLKCLFLDNSLINDKYIQTRILNDLNKRINESKLGKLYINGSFQFVYCDPYAFCEYIFGMKIKGLLNEFEFYSNYWNKKDAVEICGMRSPMTWRAEVNYMPLKNTREMQEWYKYLTSGIILNIYGVDRDIFSSMDFDGDTLATTDNKVYLRCRYGGVPVLYEPKKAQKFELTKENLKDIYKVDMFGFDTLVGYYTNIGTSYYCLLSKFEIGSDEYNEIIKRLKLICIFQNLTIDATKGLELKKIPKHWTTYSKILDSDSEYERKEKEFNNKLVIPNNKRPYFMKYVYSNYMKKHNEFVKDFDLYCGTKFGHKYNEITESQKQSEPYINLLKYYEQKNPLMEFKSDMNRICWYLEKKLKEVKKITKNCNSIDIYNKLYNNNFKIDKIKLNQMKDFYNMYYDFKKNKMLEKSQYYTYNQFYKNLKNQALETISCNIQELANLALYLCYCENKSHSKGFCWDVFGDGIKENLLEKINKVMIPMRCDYGDIKYLSQNYKMVELDLGKNKDVGKDEGIDLFENAEDLFNNFELLED